MHFGQGTGLLLPLRHPSSVGCCLQTQCLASSPHPHKVTDGSSLDFNQIKRVYDEILKSCHNGSRGGLLPGSILLAAVRSSRRAEFCQTLELFLLRPSDLLKIVNQNAIQLLM
jgi:hypothetical protein